MVHWTSALLVIALLISAFLFRYVTQWYDVAFDWHIIFGQMLGLVLILRAGLAVFGKGSERYSSWFLSLRPGTAQFQSMLEMLRFYVTMGRTPLPRWYAHNPLWAPIYALFWGLLAVTVISAVLQDAAMGWLGINWAEWHRIGAQGVLGFIVAHVIAVFMHDLKGESADVSAMINGQRYFTQGAERPSMPSLDATKAVGISVDFKGMPTKPNNQQENDH